ncbi:MAG: hypothetical protein HXY34_04215 [Candidatus Thorarchaeota archaeon]|nr:hypothetical protein [Candidatus Thorarchaeota archaeon]
MDELDCEHWNASGEEVIRDLRSFIDEFGSFTPDWFIEVKFHLLRTSGFTRESRMQFCRLSIRERLCPSCSSLYLAKECPLWYRLFRAVRKDILRRAPPCIRLAYEKRNILKVVDYMVKAGLLSPPFYHARMAPSCKSMAHWGYCRPDEYCHFMTVPNTLEYTRAREEVRRSGRLPSDGTRPRS